MNAPAGFQRFVEHCLESTRDEFVTPYLDELLPLKTYLNHLQQVFQQLRVKLFKKEVSYLVRLVSSEGHTADPRNVAAVKSQIKAPTKIITELRSTLGLVGYFRRSIPNFSKAVNPLYFLIKLHPEKSEKHLLWNSEHQ